MTEMEDAEDRSPFGRLTRESAVVALLCALPFFLFFAYLGDPAKGRAAAGSVGMIVLVVWMSWDLKKHMWFWTTIATLVLLHLPLVLFIPWTNTNYPGVVLLPFGLLDLAIMYGCIKLAERIMKRSDGISSAN
ncbi:MAG: hypothetical protein WB561_05450 [Terracidiphilus sp.]